jgi:hypothetical protein
MTSKHQRIALLFALLCAPAVYAQVAAHNSQPRQVPLLPRDLEIELALSAAPAHLRDGATVLVLGPTGFTKAQEGTNKFTCIVTRAGGDLFPVCYDEEGTRTVLPVDLDDVKLRMQGLSGSEVDRQIAEGYKNGLYRAPARPGISYMLSPIRYKIDEQGRIVRSTPNPHMMFYAPYLSDADIGGVRGSGAFINQVGPHGMMIVPVGKTEREAILKQSQGLTEKVEHLIGYTPPSTGGQ